MSQIHYKVSIGVGLRCANWTRYASSKLKSESTLTRCSLAHILMTELLTKRLHDILLWGKESIWINGREMALVSNTTTMGCYWEHHPSGHWYTEDQYLDHIGNSLNHRCGCLCKLKVSSSWNQRVDGTSNWFYSFRKWNVLKICRERITIAVPSFGQSCEMQTMMSLQRSLYLAWACGLKTYKTTSNRNCSQLLNHEETSPDNWLRT